MSKFPSLSKQSLNAINSLRGGFHHWITAATSKEYREKIKAMVTDDTYAMRISVCSRCERYDDPSNRCMECGCFLNVKARFGFERGPLDKWGPGEYEVTNQG